MSLQKRVGMPLDNAQCRVRRLESRLIVRRAIRDRMHERWTDAGGLPCRYRAAFKQDVPGRMPCVSLSTRRESSTTHYVRHEALWSKETLGEYRRLFDGIEYLIRLSLRSVRA